MIYVEGLLQGLPIGHILAITTLYVSLSLVELRMKKHTLLHTVIYSVLKIPAVLLAAAAVAGPVWMILQIQTVMGLA